MTKRNILTILCLLGLLTGLYGANTLSVPKPGEREFIGDYASMIDADDEAGIREMADTLLTETATPIIIITIDRMSDYGGRNYSIERFATELFNQWGIGHEKINDKEWNTGMLLLVSKGNRKARIELGAGWGREKDAQCQEIMDNLIIPHFKQGEFSTGIRLGAEALAQIAGGKEVPRPPIDWKNVAIYTLIAVFIAMTLHSIFRSGRDGWGWMFWAALFGLIVAIIMAIATSRSSGGGGFSGGSFGGGFSGGGGASGSW